LEEVMAETYDGPPPSDIQLIDMTAEVNLYVNRMLGIARGKARGSPKLEAEVYDQLGFPSNLAYARIEQWANALDKATPGHPGKIYQPRVEDSQYRGRSSLSLATFLAPVMMINDILIGTDKLGHFFQLGYSKYYKEILGGKSPADAATEGDKTESGTFGIDNTGVYSNADIAANRDGMQFYQNLARNPNLDFKITDYISYKWNEASNANLYGGELENMWVRNINGLWQGNSIDDASKIMINCSALLKIAERRVGSWGIGGHTEYDLTGIYTYGPSTSLGTDGRIKGSAMNHLNSANAVDRVDLEFDWEEKGNKGKGQLQLVSMNQLTGRWGNLNSPRDGGAWILFKRG
jgi:hypothetical protein